MTQEKIEIQFKPKGDKQLIAAIKQLDVVTKRLQGTTSKYEKEVEETIRSQRKLNNQLKKSNKTSLLGVKNNRLLGNSFATLRSKMLLFSFGIGLTTMAFKKLFEATIEQERVEKKLEHQLGKSNKALLNYASGLQAVTKFGDEAIIQVQGMIASFTKDEEQIKLATAATLDLAEAKGMDLKTAGDLVSKTLGSSTNALSRYGIEVVGAAGSIRRLDSLTRNISTLFKGEAVAAADTFGGSIAQMTNSVGDANEAIGNFLAPFMQRIAGFMKNAADSTKEFFTTLQEDEMETMIRRFEEFGVSAEVLKGMKEFQLTKDLEDINAQLDATGKGFKTISEVEAAIAKNTQNIETSAEATSSAVVKRTNHIKKLEALNQALIKAEKDGLHFTKDKEKIIKVINKETGKEFEMTLQLAIQRQIKLKKLVEEDRLVGGAAKKAEANLKTIKEESPVYLEIINLLKKRNDIQAQLNDLGRDDPIFKLKIEDIQEFTEKWSSSVMNVINSYNAQKQAVLDAEKATALAATNSIRSERLRARAVDKINEDFAKKQEALNRRSKRAKRTQTVINNAVSIMEVWADKEAPTLSKIVMSALVAAAGDQQLKAIDAAKYEQGGLVGGRRHSQGGTMIEAERGEYVVSRRGVDAAGLEALNRINAGQGAGGINISINNPVLSKDVVEDDLIPQIKEAIRRGADIGVG